MELGKIIRSKREELKMTQQQLADQVYVTRQTISKWELGKSTPDPISLAHLETILNVQFARESSSKEGEKSIMKKLQYLVGLLLFGVLFLPLRFLWVMIRRYWQQPWVRFIVIPVILAFSLWYLHSLKTHVFYFFLALILAAYLVTSVYFFSGQRKEEQSVDSKT